MRGFNAHVLQFNRCGCEEFEASGKSVMSCMLSKALCYVEPALLSLRFAGSLPSPELSVLWHSNFATA